MILQQRHLNFLQLWTQWSNPFVTLIQLTSLVEQASHCAITHSGAPQNTTPQFASVTMQALAEDEPVLPEEEDSAEVKPEQAALADILEGDIAGAEIEEDQDLVANVCAQVVWDSPEVHQCQQS